MLACWLAQSELPLEWTNDRGEHSRHAENDFIGRGSHTSSFARHRRRDESVARILQCHAQRRADTTNAQSGLAV